MRYASGIILWEVVWLAASIMTQSHILSCTRTHQTQTLSIFCTSQIYRQNPSLPPPSVSRKMLSHFQDRMLNQILLEKSQTQLFFNKIPPFYIKRCHQNLMNFVFLITLTLKFGPHSCLTLYPCYPSHPNHATLTLEGSHSSVLCAPDNPNP